LKSRPQCPIFNGVGHHVRWLIVTRDRFKSSMASSEIVLEAVPSVSQIPAEDWDACANPSSDPGSLPHLDPLGSLDTIGESSIGSKPSYNPFVSHAFFSALEVSG
jgi:predicted N-acyltransferase